jgi:hypothetical protein
MPPVMTDKKRIARELMETLVSERNGNRAAPDPQRKKHSRADSMTALD